MTTEYTLKFNGYNLFWPIILCIVGKSGSGKTTIAQIMEANGIPTIHSYTTRPMREGETDGVEHIFIDGNYMPSKEEMLAHTVFGGYEYFSLESQVSNPICTYVIDEDGLRNLKEHHSGKYIILSMYVTRKDNNVDEERKGRDENRKEIPMEDYDYVFENDYSLEQLEEKLGNLTKDIIGKICKEE